MVPPTDKFMLVKYVGDGFVPHPVINTYRGGWK